VRQHVANRPHHRPTTNPSKIANNHLLVQVRRLLASYW
jgi:hypothetical protein